MVSDVNYLYSVMNDTKSTTGMITCDLLGGGGVDSAKELDLDLHFPSGYEKRLDLKTFHHHQWLPTTTQLRV
nr:hypothetical protein [Tanacetum cinerariifolium]